MVRVQANPEVLRWARHRVGIDADHVRAKFAVHDWESGRRNPTLKQLQGYADATHTPIGAFFLPTPPEDTLPIADFRTIQNERIDRPSTNLLATIEICQLRQDWYRAYALENGAEPLEFVGYARLHDDPADAAGIVRRLVGIEISARAQFPRWVDAFRAFVQDVEEAGVLVMVSGVVGANNKRVLDPNEFRGFALTDGVAPLIFINGRSSLSAKTFTLAHELAHLALGNSGVDSAGLESRPTSSPGLERWCNTFAGELLVPTDDLLSQVSAAPGEPITLAHGLAHRYKVSTLVLLRRLFDIGAVGGWDEYQQIYTAERDRLLELAMARGGGGTFHRNQAARLGRRFSSAIIASVAEGRTLMRDALELTNLSKPNTFDSFARSLRTGE